MEKNKSILPYRFAKDVVNEARNIIHKERSGEQLGLYSDIPSLNRSMGKFFRFAQVNLIAGLSGSAKSYFLGKLNNAFLSPLNNAFPNKLIIIQFAFEMAASTELLRACSSDMKISYSALLSSEYNKELGDYEKLSDENLLKAEAFLDNYKNKNIIYVENSGNLLLIYNTVEHIVNKARNKYPNKNINFVVNIDHTLLIEKLGERDLLELMLNTGRLSIVLRKRFACMVNLIGQLNNSIEDIRRLIDPALHYPQKSDIYAQGQIYNACDNVFIIHKPANLKIQEYGIKKLPTKNLIHLLKLKSRFGTIGNIWLKDDLKNGLIVPYDFTKKKEKDIDTLPNLK